MLPFIAITSAVVRSGASDMDARLSAELPSGAALMGNLLLVVAAIVFAAWLVTRLRRQLPGTSDDLRVVASLALGHRDRVVVLAVGDEQIVVGVSAQGMVRLHELNTPLANSAESGPVTFLTKLRQARDGATETTQ